MVFSFLKKNISKIVSYALILLSLIVALFFVKSSIDTSNFLKLLEGFPFAKFVFENVAKIIGFSGKLPDISANSVTMDLVKLLVSSSVRCLLFMLLSRLLLGVHIPRNQIIRGFKKDYEYLEEAEETVFYKIKKCIISIFTSIFSVFLSNIIIDKVKQVVAEKLSGLNTTIAYIIILAAFYVAYCILFAVISGTSFEFSIIKTAVYNIFPNLLSTFGTTFFLLIVYINLTARELNLKTVFSVLLLFAWCLFSDWFTKFCKVKFASLSKSGTIKPSVFVAFSTIYIICVSYYFLTYVGLGETAFFNDKLTKILFNLPNFPLFDFISLKLPASALFTSHLKLLISNIHKIVILAALVAISQRFKKPSNFILWYLYQCFILAVILAEYSAITYLYANNTFWAVVIIVVAILLCTLINGKGIVSIFPEIAVISFINIIIAVFLSFIPYGTELYMIVICIAVTVSVFSWYAVDCLLD